jgi:IrrE N-terminal-like domain
VLGDYKVRFCREESIAAIALLCRKMAGDERFPRFNVVTFVERVLPKILKHLKKGMLTIHFFDMNEGAIPAYVVHKPAAHQGAKPTIELHVDSEIWMLANLGDPKAKFILAHEIGHIVLHDHYAQAFSGQQIKFAQREESGEWQANTFASYLLITTDVLLAFSTAEDLARSCEVPLSLSQERFEQAMEEQRRSIRCARVRGFTGDACSNCGNFTVDRATSKCDTCGSTTGRS